jgi:hypothetical protein
MQSDTTHELSPIKNLSHETFDGGQWRAPCITRGDSGCDHLARIEQLQIE